MHTSRFIIKNIYIFHTEYSYVFRVILETKTSIISLKSMKT
jgi:hypothetical protein